MRPEPACLDTCDETHDEGCPNEAWAREYWAAYFGLKPSTPENRTYNMNQLRAFAPVGRENIEGDCVRHDMDKHEICLECGYDWRADR